MSETEVRNSEVAEVEEEDEPSMLGGLWQIVIGIGLIVFGIYMYSQLSLIEESGGSMRIHWFFYFAYKIGGKWLVSTLLGIGGAGVLYMGVKEMINSRK